MTSWGGVGEGFMCGVTRLHGAMAALDQIRPCTPAGGGGFSMTMGRNPQLGSDGATPPSYCSPPRYTARWSTVYNFLN